MADVAYMILNEWQGLGLATLLQNRIAEDARSKGGRGFTADILADGVYEVEILFD